MEILYLVYAHQTVIEPTSLKTQTGYTVVYLFQDSKFVTDEWLKDSYQKWHEKQQRVLGSQNEIFFEALEDLKSFAESLLMELPAAELFFLSSLDYNSGLQSVRDTKSYREMFRRYGQHSVHPDFKKDRGGFLQGLFKS